MIQSWKLTRPSNWLTLSGPESRCHYPSSTFDHIISFRRAYYKDMSSNLVIEKALRATSDFSCLDLSTNVDGGLQVTKEQAKGYNQYLAAFDSVRFADDLE